MEKTKVLFVAERLHGRHILGPDSFIAAVLSGLRGRDDVDARFLDVGRPRLAGRLLTRRVPFLHGADLDLHDLRWFVFHGIRTRKLVAAELRRFRADVVHVNTHAITLGAPTVGPEIPLLLSADSTVSDWRAMTRWTGDRPYARRLHKLSDRLERATLERAETVYAYTEWARERLQSAAPEADIRPLLPGIDLEHHRPAPLRPRERHRLLFVGGRFREKGGEDLLSAVGHRLGVDVELDLVTPQPPPLRPGVRTHRLGRSDPALLELFQQADLFCLPTYADTMSFATMEALGCGTPVVTTSLAGLPEVVGDAGELVPRGDVRQLRSAIDGLLDNPDRRARLRVVARAEAEERFDARRQTAVLLDRVHEAAARSRLHGARS